jgi:hypothetical protein
VTHGFYASDVVLAGENQQEFDDLLQAYRDEYCPDGASEEAAVVELASLHWKKRRLEAGLQQAIQKQRDFDASIENWDVGAAAKSQSKAVQVGCALIQKHLEQFFQHDEAKAKPDEAKANSQAVESQAVEDEAKANSQAGSQACQIVPRNRRDLRQTGPIGLGRPSIGVAGRIQNISIQLAPLLAYAHPRSSPVLIDELDTRGFEGVANHVHRRPAGLIYACFKLAEGPTSTSGSVLRTCEVAPPGRRRFRR